MVDNKQKMTKSQERLLNLFQAVKNEDVKEIMIEVVFLENQHRSGNFPRKKIKDVVDAVASLKESREEQGE